MCKVQVSVVITANWKTGQLLRNLTAQVWSVALTMKKTKQEKISSKTGSYLRINTIQSWHGLEAAQAKPSNIKLVTLLQLINSNMFNSFSLRECIFFNINPRPSKPPPSPAWLFYSLQIYQLLPFTKKDLFLIEICGKPNGAAQTASIWFRLLSAPHLQEHAATLQFFHFLPAAY